MTLMIAGLALFLGMHSISIFADDFRNRVATRSPIGWRSVYSLVSLAGIVLIAIGYGEARMNPTVLYAPPVWLQHLASVLMLPAFVLFLAPYFPGRIKQKAKHPQLVAVKLWAAAHLLANGMLADVLLFGGFLAWAVLDRISLKNRPARPVPGMPLAAANDIYVTILGLGLYGAFVLWLHHALIGKALFGIYL